MKTAKATVWTLAARQSERLIGIVSTIILARALSPQDYGVVAMAGSVAALIEVFSLFGFDWALLRIQDPQRDHYDSAWTLRLIAGICVFVALAIVAFPAALYYRESAIAPIIIMMGLNNLITSAENIGTTDFRRYMQYDKEFQLRVAAKVAGFVTAVFIVAVFRTYWALVFGMTASRFASTALSYFLHSYRPRFCLRERAKLLGFSIWMLIGSATGALAARFSDIWLGRNLGSRSVGLFSMATEIATMATSEIAAPINRVVYSSYATLAKQIDALRSAYVRVASLIWTIGVPAAVGIGVCSQEIVHTFLGDQWADASEVLALLAVAGALGIMGANTHYVYWALGKAKFVTVLSIVHATTITVLTITLGMYYGLSGVAWAQVAASAVTLTTNFAALSRTLDLNFGELFSKTYRVMLASTVMALAVIGFRTTVLATVGWSEVVELVLLICAGAITYTAALSALWTVTGKPDGPESEILRVVTTFWENRRGIA